VASLPERTKPSARAVAILPIPIKASFISVSSKGFISTLFHYTFFIFECQYKNFTKKEERRTKHRSSFFSSYARVTLPERRQREQTATVVGVPSTIAFTLRILGFQERLVLR
jgi:hypothetical protein